MANRARKAYPAEADGVYGYKSKSASPRECSMIQDLLRGSEEQYKGKKVIEKNKRDRKGKLFE
jgi:hypothetical protein